MASNSQSTCVELRSRVRSSSSWRCGSRSWQKKRSCKVRACSPARVSQVVIVACRKPKTRSAAEGSSPSASADSTTATDAKGFSNGTGRSEEHTSELQSRFDLVCRLLLEKKKETTS